ncbi:hypothetical protein J6590_068716 [Homalodisca vitripennis]|nr:hypothetical protein J6590_068716 [Homalodisca vitripennis]
MEFLKQKLSIHIAILFFATTCSCAVPRKKNATLAWDPDTEDFKTLIWNGVFVDKTFMINETLNCEEKVLQITRPRKWGKTLNLDMLRRFLEIELDKNGDPLPEDKRVNTALFKGGKLKLGRRSKTVGPLKISRWDEEVMSHLGKHPVIHLSLKDVKGRNYVQFEEKLKNIVAQLFLNYPFFKKYMEDGNDVLDVGEKIRLAKFITGKFEDEDFICCFEFLSMLLYKRFNSDVCIFIDDYDYPIINAFLEFGDKNREFDSIVMMLRVLFENAFKENQYLYKGIITGTLNFFVVASGISEYHYVGFNTIMDLPFSSHYGFTQKDIGELIGRTNILLNPFHVRRLYGGVHVFGEEIYIPLSIMKCMWWKGQYDYYLAKSYPTDFTRMLDRAFLMEGMQEHFQLLIEGKEVVRSSLSESVYLRSVSGDFFSVFVHAGYLYQIPPERPTDKPIWRVKIPNMEIRAIFATGVGKWAAQELKLSEIEYEKFVNLLVSSQVDKFSEELEQLLTLNNCSIGTKEKYYHSLVAGIISSLGVKYLVESIKDHGRFKGGNILIPFQRYGNTCITIEYTICNVEGKLLESVNDSFQSLINAPRSFSFKLEKFDHIEKILYLAMGFCGPKVLVKHRIENVKDNLDLATV